MKQVVLSLSDKGEERLRRLAHDIRGGRKGALSETVEEALEVLENKKKQQAAFERLKKIADENRVLGVGKFERAELYRRN